MTLEVAEFAGCDLGCHMGGNEKAQLSLYHWASFHGKLFDECSKY
jgi:hypothetical protein